MRWRATAPFVAGQLNMPKACQSARKKDPRSASKRDPFRCGLCRCSIGEPARRGVPFKRLTRPRAGGSCGPTGASPGTTVEAGGSGAVA